MNTRQIKSRMVSIGNTKQITRAMEAVAATKMRRAQETALRARAYAEAALALLSELPGSVAKHHPLFAERKGNRHLFIVIGSDKGLCAGYNSNVIKSFLETAAKEESAPVVLPLGRRMRQFALRRKYQIAPFGVEAEDLFERAAIIDAAADAFSQGEFDKVFLTYTNFISTLKQVAVTRQLLPFTRETLKEIVDHIVPVRGRYSQLRQELEKTESAGIFKYEFEPAPEAILTEVLSALLQVALYHALVEAEASEHSARMVAMKSASDNATTLLEQLTLTFNKARQLAITREVAEITSGKEALETS